MWFQLFIEVLLRMHHKSTDRKELIDICKKNYKGNKQEMSIIEDFEKNYKANNAIWWYTREACFYRMMNKALRVQDYDILFALRFFITDIAKQLKNEHEKFIRTSTSREVIRVYRGQAIGIDEFELMKKSVGEFLSMNSFLSTSRNRSTAIDFARSVSTNDGNQSILFEIEIDPRSKTKAFGDISQMSYYENEGEVLIMLGALFRIEKIEEDKKKRMWIVHVTLASEDDYQLKETFAYMKEKIGDDTNLDSLGKILLEMGEYRQAQKCYERLLEETQLNFGDAQSGLGWARLRCEEYDESLEHFEKALHARKELFGEQHAMVGQIYSHMGGLKWFQGDYDQGIINLKKAISILENAHPPDRLALAKSYHNIATNYHDTDAFDLALEYYNKALEIRQVILPADHPDIAMTCNNLGSLYEENDIEKALLYYKRSLDIRRKTLPPTHPDINKSENNIRRVKNQMKKQ
jgi:tetratricopeptide (TPR) repeat protein